MIKQVKGSDVDEWFMQRWTKFTSSEKYKLLPSGEKGAVFSAGGKTYIKTKALEMSTVLQERPELDEVKSLLHGKVHEYPAYEWYIGETKNYSMVHLGTDTPLFLVDNDNPKESGGSPDGLSLGETQIIAGLETKCPRNSMYHFDRLLWKDQWDIKANYISCYTQIQDLLRITGADFWHFLSYDDRQKSHKNKGKIIEVKPDKKFQDNLVLRTKLAVEEKYKEYEKHMNR